MNEDEDEDEKRNTTDPSQKRARVAGVGREGEGRCSTLHGYTVLILVRNSIARHSSSTGMRFG